MNKFFDYYKVTDSLGKKKKLFECGSEMIKIQEIESKYINLFTLILYLIFAICIDT